MKTAPTNAHSSFAKAKFVGLETADWNQGGFFFPYESGPTAEVSWALVRQLPPKK